MSPLSAITDGNRSLRRLLPAERTYIGTLRFEIEEYVSPECRKGLSAELERSLNAFRNWEADASTFFLRLKRTHYSIQAAKDIPSVFATFVRIDLAQACASDEQIQEVIGRLSTASPDELKVAQVAVVEQSMTIWSQAVSSSSAATRLHKWASLILGSVLLLFLIDGQLAAAVKALFMEGFWAFFKIISTFLMLHAVAVGIAGTAAALLYYGPGRIVPDRLDSHSLQWAVSARLTLGGWAGLIAFFIISLSINPFSVSPALNQSLLLAGCFAAGFTDRYFVGAVEGITRRVFPPKKSATRRSPRKKKTP